MRANGGTVTLEELITEAGLPDVVTSGAMAAFVPLHVVGPDGSTWPVHSVERAAGGLRLSVQPDPPALQVCSWGPSRDEVA